MGRLTVEKWISPDYFSRSLMDCLEKQVKTGRMTWIASRHVCMLIELSYSFNQFTKSKTWNYTLYLIRYDNAKICVVITSKVCKLKNSESAKYFGLTSEGAQTFEGAKVFADFRFESLYRYYLQSLQTSDESLKLKVLLKVSRLDWAFLNPFEKWHHASGFI